MSHQNLVQQLIGTPGSSADVGNSPATQGDLLSVTNALENSLLNLPDPFAHRQITNADIKNLTVTSEQVASLSFDKLTSGTITSTASVGNGQVTIDGVNALLTVSDGVHTRVKLGNLSGDYGLQIFNASGTLMWSATSGAQTAGISNLAVTDAKINDLTVDKLTTGNFTATGTLTSGAIQSGPSGGARIVLNSSGLFGYNSSNLGVFALDTNGGNAQLVVQRSDGQDMLVVGSYDNVAQDGARIGFFRARGSIASPSAVQAGDILLELAATGYASSGGFSHGSTADIRVVADEGFTGTAKGAKIQFLTTRDNSLHQAVRWTIHNNGLLEGFLDTGDANSSVISLADKAAGSGPTPSTDARVYFRNHKLVVAFNDGGTNKYFYLDTTQAGTANWAYTTTAP